LQKLQALQDPLLTPQDEGYQFCRAYPQLFEHAKCLLEKPVSANPADYESRKVKNGLIAAQQEGWLYMIRVPADITALEHGCYFDQDRAEHFIKFIETILLHTKGSMAGQPFILLDWQRADFQELFGWVRPDGFRRYQQAMIEVAKKNGKSTLCAAICLYLLIADGEVGAEVYTAATTRDQAKICWKHAADMVKASPLLDARCEVIPSGSRIVFEVANSMMRAISAEAGNAEGLDGSAVVLDELHVHKKPDLFRALRYAGAARDQPLLISITTAGVFDPESIGWEQHIFAENILRGINSDSYDFFARVYAAAKDDDWRDPAAWLKANPSMGATIKETELELMVREVENSPQKVNEFKRYRVNLWVQSADGWLNMDRYMECSRLLKLSDFKRQTNIVGIDLASISDMCAAVLVCQQGNNIKAISKFWLPEAVVRPSSKNPNMMMYANWVDRGFLNLTPGHTTNYDWIHKQLRDWQEDVGVAEVGLDPYNATQFSNNLLDDGFEVQYVRQGPASMGAAMSMLEAAVLEGWFEHDGNPILDWCLGNTSVHKDVRGNMSPMKLVDTNKIDGTSALVTGIARLITMAPQRESVYESRGMLSI